MCVYVFLSFFVGWWKCVETILNMQIPTGLDMCKTINYMHSIAHDASHSLVFWFCLSVIFAIPLTYYENNFKQPRNIVCTFIYFFFLIVEFFAVTLWTKFTGKSTNMANAV